MLLGNTQIKEQKAWLECVQIESEPLAKRSKHQQWKAIVITCLEASKQSNFVINTKQVCDEIRSESELLKI